MNEEIHNHIPPEVLDWVTPFGKTTRECTNKLLAKAERRVRNHPIERLLNVLNFQEIGNLTKAIVEHVKRRNLAEIWGESD